MSFRCASTPQANGKLERNSLASVQRLSANPSADDTRVLENKLEKSTAVCCAMLQLPVVALHLEPLGPERTRLEPYRQAARHDLADMSQGHE